MEQFVAHLLHAAAWTFGIIFLFALIGIIATIRWIFSLIFKTERAVEGGIQSAEGYIHRKP
jgi:hypothetical protein